ncbi:MAG: ABC-type Fe3+-siderophore transport system, permease component, partial [Arthrobacter sp.]|nr:ABC-type Fe3+-siderophore transport system, permease component [Arthrobacter sp.]
MTHSTTTAASREGDAGTLVPAKGFRHPVSGGKRAAWLLAAVVVLALLAAASLAVGARGLPLGTVWEALAQFDPANGDHAVVHARIPRTVLGLLAGGALGLA